MIVSVRRGRNVIRRTNSILMSVVELSLRVLLLRDVSRSPRYIGRCLACLLMFTVAYQSKSNSCHAGMCEEGNSFIGAAEVGGCVALGMCGKSICHVLENTLRTERIVRHYGCRLDESRWIGAVRRFFEVIWMVVIWLRSFKICSKIRR